MYVDILEKSGHSITSILYQLNREMKSIWLQNAPKFIRPLTVSKIFDINVLFKLISKNFLSTKKSERGRISPLGVNSDNIQEFIYLYSHYTFIHLASQLFINTTNMYQGVPLQCTLC